MAAVPSGWFAQHARTLKSIFRVVFGAIWGIDGALKFDPTVVANFPSMVQDASRGQPAWLAPWFSFWSAQAAADPAFWVYMTGFLELALAFALVAGFLRKLAYLGGCGLSLFIWAVPEGFGGPYGPSSTDIGTGIIYAMTFLMLLVINAAYGPSRYSLDAFLERRWPGWSKFAEAGLPALTAPVAGRQRGGGRPEPSTDGPAPDPSGAVRDGPDDPSEDA